ncbi:MAG: hypothetical protein GY751_25710, partial [Bacteroidetes bacterium]|nr:hypothetical protein [Bacteroidota bacterium]
MKTRILTLCLFFSIALHIPYLAAQEEPAPEDAYGIELRYKYFESNSTPRDHLRRVQNAAMAISAECKKGEDACNKIIDEFNYPFTRWNNLNGLEPTSSIHHFEKKLVVAHPNSALHNKRYIENFLFRFKDYAGRSCFLEGYSKLSKQPEGVFMFQYTTWTKSKTKIASPAYNLNVLVIIPGTPYLVSSPIPYRAYSVEEMDKTVEYLDSMVKHWSIMKSDGSYLAPPEDAYAIELRYKYFESKYTPRDLLHEAQRQ